MASKRKTAGGSGGRKVLRVTCKGHTTAELDDLTPLQGNLKKLDPKDFERLKGSIIDNGISFPLFVWRNKRKTYTLDGTQREVVLRALRDDGYMVPPLPVDLIDAKDKSEAKYKILLASSRYGQVTEQGLSDFLNDMSYDLEQISQRIQLPEFDMADFFESQANAQLEEVESPHPPDKSISRSGDWWEIDQHKLICGDCSDESIIRKLLGSERPVLMATDPPYGLNIVKYKKDGGLAQTSNTESLTRKLGKIGVPGLVKNTYYLPIRGDDKPFNPTPFLNMAETIVLFGANNYADKLPPTSGWIVWDKKEDVSTGSFFSDCELAWTNKMSRIKKFAYLWAGIARRGNRTIETKKRVHPTQKPVALFGWLMNEFTKSGDLCFDPFLGSGPVLLAAEQLGRRCFGIEIEPTYIDICVARYLRMKPKAKILCNGKAVNTKPFLRLFDF